MKKILVLFVLLSFLPAAAAETQIFSGKILTGSDRDIDGNIFKFTYEPTSDKVFVQTPSTGLIVENGACKSNAVFRICINSANFSYKNVTTYVYYYEVDATIYKLTGSLSAAGKAASNSLLPGESTEFTITITNPTDFDISDIKFSYDLAPFLAINANGCELKENRLEWHGSLSSKYDRTCTATITAESEGTFNLAGNLSYFNSFETEKKNTATLQITVLPKQLRLVQSYDNYTEIKQPFYFNTSLQNINKQEKKVM